MGTRLSEHSKFLKYTPQLGIGLKNSATENAANAISRAAGQINGAIVSGGAKLPDMTRVSEDFPLNNKLAHEEKSGGNWLSKAFKTLGNWAWQNRETIMDIGFAVGSMFLDPHPGTFDDEDYYLDVDYVKYHVRDVASRFKPLAGNKAVDKLLVANDVILQAIGNRRGF